MVSDLLKQVIDVVYLAANIFDRANIEQVELKNNDPVNFATNIDAEIEDTLRKHLLDIIPDSQFIGEESRLHDYHGEHLWIVDPIDGTTNFTRGLPEAAISVGLAKNYDAVLGVVYNPITKDMWYAELGYGAYLNGERIHVSDRDIQHSLFHCYFDAYNKDCSGPAFRIAKAMYRECADIRTVGSAALALANIACGREELLYMPHAYPWDVAAGICILNEAVGHSEVVHWYDDGTNRFDLLAGNSLKTFYVLKRKYEEAVTQ